MDGKIRDYIIGEVEPYYTKKNLQEIVELFWMVLDYDVSDSDLKGVKDRISSSLISLACEKHDKTSLCLLFPTICKVEPYARKVLFLTNETKYNEINSESKGLAPVLKALNIDFNKGRMQKAYELRNIEGHVCKAWTMSQLLDKITDSLIAYLVITNSRIDKLKQLVYKADETKNENRFDPQKYATNIISRFETKILKTVQLTSEENLEIAEIYAEEALEDGSKKTARKGTLRALMKSIPEKRIMLWGDAGTGKTTTLEYLVYQDAKDVLQGGSKIPVIIYLGAATNEHYTIIEYIQEKLDVDYETLKRMLESGIINLYFDGFNEIPYTEKNMLKTKRRRELTELIETYTNTFIVLTNRPQDGREFANIPVFNLLKMDDDQIKEFLSLNVDTENVLENVQSAITNDQNLRNMIKVPLILKSLIFIAKTTGEIPKREGQIIGGFLRALFTREQQEKYDEYLDENKITYLLRRIGYETKELNKTNSGVSKDYLLDIMKRCQEDYSFSYDNMYTLDLVVHLGIMQKRDDSYMFAHQSYQDYYHSQELKATLGI